MKTVLLIDDSLVIELWKGTEVDQEADLQTARFQVIDELCSMFGGESPNRFKLDDDLSKAQQIRRKDPLKLTPFMVKVDRQLRLKRYSG